MLLGLLQSIDAHVRFTYYFVNLISLIASVMGNTSTSETPSDWPAPPPACTRSKNLRAKTSHHQPTPHNTAPRNDPSPQCRSPRKLEYVTSPWYPCTVFATPNSPIAGPARAQGRREGRNPRSGQGQRSSRQGAQAHIHRMLNRFTPNS
jgi:hypothetical protein